MSVLSFLFFVSAAFSQRDVISKNDEIQFVSMLHPFLVKLNNDPKQKMDNVYLTESLTCLDVACWSNF